MAESRVKCNEQSDLNNQPTKIPKEPTKIIALNDECLVKIFSRLDLKSLFNVAIANEWLRPAAAKIYGKKYGVRIVHIKPSKPNGFLPLIEFEDAIAINGLKWCLLFLRCFGKFITNLKVSYRLNSNAAYGHINQYITTYCAEHLVRFTLDRAPNVFNELFCKSYANVECASICYGVLGEEFLSFPAWLPNVRRLKLDQVELEQEFTDVQFKHLDHLNINLGFDNSDAAKSSAFRLLNANRQLRNVIMTIEGEHFSEPLVTLLDIIKNNDQISTLIIRAGRINSTVKRIQMQRIVDEHRDLAEFDMDCHKFTANDAIWLIHRLHSAQTFNLRINDPSEYQKLEAKLAKNGKWASSYDRSCETVTLVRMG